MVQEAMGAWEWGVVSLVGEEVVGRAALGEFFPWLAGEVGALRGEPLAEAPAALAVLSPSTRPGLAAFVRSLTAKNPGLLLLFAVLPHKVHHSRILLPD